tara:strand:+ start:318 stop:1067 length:750 start_codon:yes stop_codon:yes gene_type:complete
LSLQIRTKTTLNFKNTKIINNIIKSILGYYQLRISRGNSSIFDYNFNNDQDFSLILIGAHNGRKSKKLIEHALKFGKICLVEPTPNLFNKLKNQYNSYKDIYLINKCITHTESKSIDFFITSEMSNDLHEYGDQLGSVNPMHSINHDKNFKKFTKKINVPSLTINKLLSEINCNSIDYLFIDTEGSDIEILLSFPFHKILPKKIIFEHKFSDGHELIGKKFVKCLNLLIDNNYKIKIIDSENTEALLMI